MIPGDKAGDGFVDRTTVREGFSSGTFPTLLILAVLDENS